MKKKLRRYIGLSLSLCRSQALPSSIQPRPAEADADHMLTSLKNHAEKMYQLRVWIVFRVKAYCTAVSNGELVVLDPVLPSQ